MNKREELLARYELAKQEAALANDKLWECRVEYIQHLKDYPISEGLAHLIVDFKYPYGQIFISNYRDNFDRSDLFITSDGRAIHILGYDNYDCTEVVGISEDEFKELVEILVGLIKADCYDWNTNYFLYFSGKDEDENEN